MARSSSKTKKSRTTVPVASRAADLKVEQNSGAGGIGKRERDRLDLAGYGLLAVVVIFFLLAVSVPLNNFYDGRTEIARLNEAISAKSAEKERLLSEIEKYKSQSYIEQEARRRLGVVAPGETAYRILDPQMHSADSVTTDKQAEADAREWYSVLWDSVAQPTETQAADAPAVADSPAP